MPKTLSAKTLKLVPAINCNLKVFKLNIRMHGPIAYTCNKQLTLVVRSYRCEAAKYEQSFIAHYLRQKKEKRTKQKK